MTQPERARVVSGIISCGLRHYDADQSPFLNDDDSPVEDRAWHYCNNKPCVEAFLLHDKRTFRNRDDRTNVRTFLKEAKLKRPCEGCGAPGGNNCTTIGCDVGKTGRGHKSIVFGKNGTYTYTILLVDVVAVDYIHSYYYLLLGSYLDIPCDMVFEEKEKMVRAFLHSFCEDGNTRNHTFFVLPCVFDVSPIIYDCSLCVDFGVLMFNVLKLLTTVMEFDTFCFEKGYNALSAICYLYCNGVYRSLSVCEYRSGSRLASSCRWALRLQCEIYMRKIRRLTYLALPPGEGNAPLRLHGSHPSYADMEHGF
jgi:hypothetical protein